MATPQNSPRGLFAKSRIDVGAWSITQNSTALIMPNSVRIGSKATYLSSNSTGVKLGSLYISCNSTGNTTTQLQKGARYSLAPQKVDEILNCYIGVVESEIEYGLCRDSIEKIIIREGDIKPVFIRATKGYEARQQHFNNWLKDTNCEMMLILDGDMIFPPNVLETLRSRNLPYISGTYLRRTYSPTAPVWFEKMDGVNFPYKPFTQKIEPNQIIEIGASGWGCILIHREVAEAVQNILKGESFVLEDDMDIYPYDLNRIMTAIHVLDNISKKENIPASALRDYIDILKEEIRPLRITKDIVGSDIRFPFFAKLAGYPLYLDTSVQCGHMLNYNLMPSDYQGMPDEVVSNIEQEISKQVRKERDKIKEKNNIADLAKVEGTLTVEGVNLSEEGE